MGGYNPLAYFTPHAVEVAGEVKNTADQMPGGYNNSVGHWDAHLYYNGVWQDGWLTTLTTHPFYWSTVPLASLAYSNGKQFYIFDTSCSY